MPRHIRITCPHCQRADLRIRPEHLGQKVQCKYCNQIFQARAPAETEDSPAVGEDRDETGTGQPAPDIRPLEEARARVESLECQIGTLQEQLEEARQKSLQEIALRQEAETAQAARVEGLEEAARTVQAQAEELRSELLALREAARPPAPDVAEALARERDALATERDRLRDEASAARAELEANAADTAGRLARLAAELEDARAGRDRAEAAREQAAGEAEQARTRLAERERTLAEANAGHEAARGSWEAERRELQARREEDRRDLVEQAERRAREEREAGRRQAEEDHAPLRQEADRLRNELEAARRQADERAAERDRLTGARDDVEEALRDLQAEHTRLALELAATSRQRDELAARILDLETTLDRHRQEREGEARDHAKELEASRLEREAERLRNEGFEAALVRAEQERDSSRQEAGRLAAELDAARRETLAASRRGDALHAQQLTLQGELDGFRRDRDAEGEQHRRALEGLRQELDAARTDLQRRLAEALRDQRAAVERAEQLEAELQSLRDRRTVRPDSEPGRPGPAPPGGAGDSKQGVEELAQQLRLAQEANERLRSFLAVFGPHNQAIVDTPHS